MAPGVVVAAHLERCARCCGEVRGFERAEGELMASLPEVALAPDALGRAFEALEGKGKSGGRATRPVRERVGDVVLPKAFAALGTRPRRWLTPEFWIAHARAPSADGWRVYLLRAPPGVEIPWHRHGGDELIAVLKGVLQDGARLGEGDFAQHSAGGSHAVTVGAAGACACLVASRGSSDWPGIARLTAAWLGI
jgi:putative transcriptional regulator